MTEEMTPEVSEVAVPDTLTAPVSGKPYALPRDTFKGRYAKGYHPDQHDKSTAVPLRALLGARVRVAAEASLEQYMLGIFDQIIFSDCVGWAFAQSIATRCAAAGTPIPLPAPGAIYTHARAAERAQRGVAPTAEKLIDNGCMPQLAVLGMQTFGVPSNDRWPLDATTINAEPSAMQLEYASQFLLTGYYRIDSEGDARLDDIRHAIASGFPVAFGTQVDQAFEDYTGKDALGAPDDASLLGGHMMHVIAYFADGTFLIVNQWGKSWGQMGMARVKPSFFTNPNMGDLVVITCSASGH